MKYNKDQRIFSFEDAIAMTATARARRTSIAIDGLRAAYEQPAPKTPRRHQRSYGLLRNQSDQNR